MWRLRLRRITPSIEGFAKNSDPYTRQETDGVSLSVFCFAVYIWFDKLMINQYCRIRGEVPVGGISLLFMFTLKISSDRLEILMRLYRQRASLSPLDAPNSIEDGDGGIKRNLLYHLWRLKK